MYYLKTESSFDSAHFLKGYNGKCRNLHGHRWRVVVDDAVILLQYYAKKAAGLNPKWEDLK